MAVTQVGMRQFEVIINTVIIILGVANMGCVGGYATASNQAFNHRQTKTIYLEFLWLDSHQVLFIYLFIIFTLRLLIPWHFGKETL